MKTKRMIWILAAVLLCVTAAAAVLHLTTRQKVPEGILLVQYGEKTIFVPVNDLELTEIRGTVINGKGEQQEVLAEGLSIADLLKAARIDTGAVASVSAVADDEFSAELQAEEINASDIAFLAREEDGTLRLIVFGDRDLKRNVRNVVRLEVK